MSKNTVIEVVMSSHNQHPHLRDEDTVKRPNHCCVRVCDLSWQDPALSNGRITGFKLKIESKENLRNGSEEWELIPVNNSVFGGSSGRRTLLKRVLLPDSESMKVSVVAINSVGESPVASLIIPDKMLGR